MDNAASLDVANTILSQLGGKRFIVMTGARNLAGDATSLRFSLPRGFAQSGITRVHITLDPSDTYTVEFFKPRGRMDYTSVAKIVDVYCDQLQSVFTHHTGLYTSLT